MRGLHNPSIIRRGNHFIRMGGEIIKDGWVLIDGPWFSLLEKIRGSSWVPVRLDKPILDIVWEDTYKLNIRPLEFIEWEPMMWHPGILLHPKMVGRVDFRWNRVLTFRKRVGYFMRPDARLPAFLNYPEWIEDEWYVDAMMQMGN